MTRENLTNGSSIVDELGHLVAGSRVGGVGSSAWPDMRRTRSWMT